MRYTRGEYLNKLEELRKTGEENKMQEDIRKNEVEEKWTKKPNVVVVTVVVPAGGPTVTPEI